MERMAQLDQKVLKGREEVVEEVQKDREGNQDTVLALDASVFYVVGEEVMHT